MMQQRGFTLIELIITLAIAAILTAIAVPSFTTTIKNNRLTTKTNALVSSLNLARSEAVKRRASVNISTSNGSSNWEHGWNVWIETDGNAGMAPSEQLWAVEDFSNAGITIISTSDILTYNSRGIAITPDTIEICDNRTGETGRQLVISATGRIDLDRTYGGCS